MQKFSSMLAKPVWATAVVIIIIIIILLLNAEGKEET